MGTKHQEFDFNPIYIKGKDNAADSLSRPIKRIMMISDNGHELTDEQKT